MSNQRNISRGVQLAIIPAVLLVLMLAVGAWAYDNSRKDQIAPGVSIGGVDVGGRSVDEARPLVEKKVVAPLGRAVTVKFEGQAHKLTAEEFDQRADVEGMLDEAVDVSREGGIPTRLIRYAGGGEVNRDISPRVSYSKKAVSEFVDEVAASINQEPQNASIEPSGDQVTPTPGQDGVSLREEDVSEQIEDKLQDPVGERLVEATVDRVPPEITRAELATEYPRLITIDRASFKLRLFRNLKLVKTYTIAVGQAGYDTPAGLYDIQSKQVNPTWYVPDDAEWAGDLAGQDIPPGPSNPLKARWMGFYEASGIHGTDDVGSLGTAASHGCIRMSVPEVVELFDKVETGDPLYIQ